MEFTHKTHVSKGRSTTEISQSVSPLEGYEALLSSKTLTRDEHHKLCRANVLSTHRINKDKAQASVYAIYKRAGLAAPLIIWTQSPLETIFAKICVDVFAKKERDTPWRTWREDNWREDHYIHDNTPFRLGAVQSVLKSGWQFGGIPTGASVLDAINVYEGPDANEWNHYAHLRSIDGYVLDSYVPVNISASVRWKIRSHMWSDWAIVSWSIFLFNEKYIGRFFHSGYVGYETNHNLKLQELRLSLLRQKNLSCHPVRFFNYETGKAGPTHMLPGFFELMQHTGWVMPYENICFISERHSQINLDARGRLHCETGPAIAYPDGFCVHAWHGTVFPEEWLQGKLSAQDAISTDNVELRRVACELIGWDKVLNKLHAVTVNKDIDPEIGELLSVNISGVDDEKFLRVICGTGRTFILPVPPNMRTAREANAWTWGLAPHQYKPEVRT